MSIKLIKFNTHKVWVVEVSEALEHLAKVPPDVLPGGVGGHDEGELLAGSLLLQDVAEPRGYCQLPGVGHQGVCPHLLRQAEVGDTQEPVTVVVMSRIL